MIKKLNQDEGFAHNQIDDVRRIQAVFWNHGYSADLKDCADIWEEYSDMYAAGWLALPKSNNDLWDVIEGYVEKFAV